MREHFDDLLGEETSPLPRGIFSVHRRLKDFLGKAQPTLLIYNRDGIKAVPLTENKRITIGRKHPSEVVLRDSCLSRQHSMIQLHSGQVWVEDLRSTNGTWIDGERVRRAQVSSNSVIRFGVNFASVQSLNPKELRFYGLSSHEHFLSELDAEISRSKNFSRSFSLVIIREPPQKTSQISRWFPFIRQLMRAFDRIALYSINSVELLLPETSEQDVVKLLEPHLPGPFNLTCGVAQYPEHGSSVDALIEAAGTAGRMATNESPIKIAGSSQSHSLVDDKQPDSSLVVVDSSMKRVFETARKVAESSIPAVIIGETGVGKEVIAREIHSSSKRKKAPMICVNCGAIPSQLVESTLFGHERGAFSSAHKQSKGVFESAHRGTVLLDEISELPLNAQVALLRVLETNRFTRVGSTQEIEVDVRVVAATNRELRTMTQEGSFRRDLLYRLDAITIRIPPLRERTDEIEPLAQYFITLANQANDCKVKGIQTEALDLLCGYSWPGNVRELRNAVERGVVLAREGLLVVDDLPEQIRNLDPPRLQSFDDVTGERSVPTFLLRKFSLRDEMHKYEALLILQALRQTNWNRKEAATALGLPLRTLAHKMSQYNIRKSEYPKNP